MTHQRPHTRRVRKTGTVFKAGWGNLMRLSMGGKDWEGMFLAVLDGEKTSTVRPIKPLYRKFFNVKDRVVIVRNRFMPTSEGVIVTITKKKLIRMGQVDDSYMKPEGILFMKERGLKIEGIDPVAYYKARKRRNELKYIIDFKKFYDEKELAKKWGDTWTMAHVTSRYGQQQHDLLKRFEDFDKMLKVPK